MEQNVPRRRQCGNGERRKRMQTLAEHCPLVGYVRASRRFRRYAGAHTMPRHGKTLRKAGMTAHRTSRVGLCPVGIAVTEE